MDTRSRSFGQSLVEFALLLPVFAFLVIVIFDLGRVIYYYSAIYNAAREGVRYGIIHPNDAAGVKIAVVEKAISLGLDVANVRYGRGNPEMVGFFQNPTVKVIVGYCFNPVTPMVERLLPNTPDCSNEQKLFLTSQAVMRTEVIPSPTLTLP